ncbi:MULTISPECIES: endonuclease V [Anaeromyxobacter]|uniref:endonuclease V n=1 Tax=Anaeromyxobacter TaxID=161492 RepID=UPI001F56294E|nr:MULTISPECIES: endonuclease V [unclassified Anaeromyxobacter]
MSTASPPAWPRTRAELEAAQASLGRTRPPPWRWEGERLRVAGCALVAGRGRTGGEGEDGFAAAALVEVGAGAPCVLVYGDASGPLGAGFESGLLALREGPLLAAAVAALPEPPDVLLVHAAGRDHPRGAGLAVMLGAILDVPSIGVTQRPLVAAGPPPEDRAGARAPLARDGEELACWLRIRRGVRPIVAHAAWRTTPDVAAGLVLATTLGTLMPEPLRRARERARALRDGRAA